MNRDRVGGRSELHYAEGIVEFTPSHSSLVLAALLYVPKNAILSVTMKLYAKQGGHRFLIALDGDPKTRTGVGLAVDTKTKTVLRVKTVPTLMRQGRWLPITENDLTLEQLVARVPALRPYRGIEVRLSSGETAWIRWGAWWSESASAQRRLTEATQGLSVPKYEPDGDHFLAIQAMAVLGGEVLDAPRAVSVPLDEAY